MSGLRQSLRRAYATAVLAYAGGGFQRGSYGVRIDKDGDLNGLSRSPASPENGTKPADAESKFLRALLCTDVPEQPSFSETYDVECSPIHVKLSK